MKKIISIAFAAMLAGFAISCQKEEVVSDKTDAVQYTFNIIVNDRAGFDNDASTKGDATYKSAWENGDKIFLFFKPTEGSLLDDKYATLTYNGSSWDGTVSSGTSSLGDGGTLSAVYVYKLGSNVTPSYSDSKWIIATGNTFYNCQTGVDYTVSGDVISATLNLEAPTNFVQFYVTSATGALTCDQVKGWKDIAIGSDMVISNVTCTGYMDGFDNSGDSNVKEYYGRIVNNGTSLENKDCKFSVVKDGKVYERTATPSSDARSFYMEVRTDGDKPWTEAEGKLPGLFTVGKGADVTAGTEDDVQVRFSQGNLYAKDEGAAGSPDWKWHFYDKQYEFLAADMAKSGSTDNPQRTVAADEKEIHLFTWGYSESTSLSPTGTGYVTGHPNDGDKLDYEKVSSAGGDDWGVAYCESNNITVGTWRTLTSAEWQYLLNYGSYTSEVRNGKYKYGVTVCSKANCVVLLPDNWDETVISLTNFAAQNTYDESSNPKWSEMEAAGAVCLPAAGSRGFGISVNYVGVYGTYWSSTAYDGGRAYDVYFGSGSFDFYGGSRSNYGISVRLITDVK